MKISRIKQNDYSYKFLIIFSLLSSIFFLFIAPRSVFSADLILSPQSKSVNIGETFTITLFVNSPDQSINAISVKIKFDPNYLRIISLSKADSKINLWVQEPRFDNDLGEVFLEGIIFNPGFIGNNGKIISLKFKALQEGTTEIKFFSGAVLANDGEGTNVLAQMSGGTYTIKPAFVTPPVEELPSSESAAPLVGVPPAPIISSPTHPDPNKWYKNPNPKFSWQLPADVTAVRLLYDKFPNSEPRVVYEPPISEKQLENLADGIWYFHVQFQNKHGWGRISHFRFQIDTEKPERLEITEIPRADLTEPKVRFIFNASDKTSGIDYYEVQIDNQVQQIWRDDGSHRYETPVLKPGKYTLIVKAVDKAGNSTTNFADFIIEPLEPPIITDYPKKLASEEILIIKGKTKYLNAQISLWLRHEKGALKNDSVKSDQDGNFTFVIEDKLAKGIYTAWAEVTDARGAKSNPSEKVTIIVEQPILFRIGSRAIEFLAVIVPLIALIFLLVYLLYYWWHKFTVLKKKVKKEVGEAEQALHKAFDFLKEDILEQIEMLEKARSKRQLTEEEEKIINKLKKDLDNAEKFVKKEIEDIEKTAE